MKSIAYRVTFTTLMILASLAQGDAAVAKSAAAQEIEKAFDHYTKEMRAMAKDCQKTNQKEAMECVCSYMEELFQLKALVENAAQSAPQELVTFRVEDKSETVKIGKLAEDMKKTNKMASLCADPAATVKKLSAYKAHAMQLSAQTMLRTIHRAQIANMAEEGSYRAFAKVGAGTKRCEVAPLELKVLSCDKTPYFYTASPSKDGKTFTAEARTRTGKEHGIFPGCATPDVWRIDEKGNLRHILDAEEKC